MRPYVIINGVNSNTITGLIISKLPPVSKPQMRVLTEQIDGRDGDINTPLGFSAYDKPLEIGLTAEADVNEVIAYFNQAGEIIFSNEPDKYYKFAIYDATDFEKLIRFKTATVNLHTQPYKYSNTQGALALNSGSNTVVNSGNTVSKPDLILEGSGVVNLSINNRQIIEADLTDVNNILIDSDTMNAYEVTLINPIKSLKSDINPVQSGTGTPSPQNVRPISGFSALNVTRTGVNLGNFQNGYGIDASGNIVVQSGRVSTVTPIIINPSLSYYVKNVSNKRFIYAVFKDNTLIRRIANVTSGTLLDTTNGNKLYVCLYDDVTVDTDKPMVVFDNAITTYEPYNGQTVIVNFGQTVYGGVADVTNGRVTITHGIVDLGTMSWIKQETNLFYARDNSVKGNSVCICDSYDYQINSRPPTRNDKTINTSIYFALHAISIYDTDYDDVNSFKASLSGKYCVYELATPIEITMTPENLTAISGENNVYSDTNGNTEVKVDIDGEEQTFTGEIVTFNINELDYELGAFANRIVTGNYDNIKLEVGSNNVELTGAFTGGQLTKYSRWL